jgi:hypothetical protein
LLNLLNAADESDSGVDTRVPRYPCGLKALPKSKLVAAAQKAVEINPANHPATHLWAMSGVGAAASTLPPEAIAVLTTKYWGTGGVHLTVGFMEPIEPALKDKILSHMNAWSQYANVTISPAPADQTPQVRVTRNGGGYASYLGTDILNIDPSQPTMWLQDFSPDTPDSEFFRVVRHETGHTLGFPHEHMRQEIVNRIDREKAIALFMRTQGWSRDEVIAQVLTPIDQSALNAAPIDPSSIMCYALPGSIMTDGQPVPGGTDIDAEDGQFAGMIYPNSGAAPGAAPGPGPRYY